MSHPTFKQMRNRNLGHVSALRKLADGHDLLGPSARPSEIRGMRTMLATLQNWGCVEMIGTLNETTGSTEYRYEVTCRGYEFLAWLDLP